LTSVHRRSSTVELVSRSPLVFFRRRVVAGRVRTASRETRWHLWICRNARCCSGSWATAPPPHRVPPRELPLRSEPRRARGSVSGAQRFSL